MAQLSRARVLASAGVLLSLVALPAASRVRARSRVTAVHFWSYRDSTRVSVEMTGPFTLRCDRLDHPDRLFFDFVGSASALGGKGVHTFPVGDALVRQIRVAETQHGVTRVVLDLNQAARFTTSRLENPPRLMIELHEAGGPATATAARRTFTAPPERRVPPPATLPEPPRLDPFDLGLDSAAIYSAAISNRTAARLFAPWPTPRPLPRALAASGKTQRAPVNPFTATAPARRAGGAEESLTRALGLKIRRVVIDAGHGGHDTGTIGAGGLLEKDLVLDVALRLGKLVEQRLGAEVIYTRSDDTFIRLQERTRIANESHADLFLSIHANSSPQRSASGVETYYLNFTTSQPALELAARENASSEQTVYELKDLLQKIALQDKIDESREFGACIQKSLYIASTRIDPRSRDRGVRKAPFVVLIGASMPSVLAEIGFISNPRDASALRKSEARKKIADALYQGVAAYSNGLSHFAMAERGAR